MFTRATFALLVLLQVWIGVSGYPMAIDIEKNINTFIKKDSWALAPVGENATVQSVTDLRDGVYAISLTAERPACGSAAFPRT